MLAQKQMQIATCTEKSLQEELEIRQTQFTTLMQCMLDLKANVQQQQESSAGGNGKDDEDDEEAKEGAVPMDTSV